jgi:hypothetical protein
MPAVSPEVEAFFAEFERAGNVLDLTSIETQYAPFFLSADPNGTQPVPREALLAALPKRREMFASVGGTVAHLTGIRETPLDASYVLVDTDWAMSVGTDGEPIHLSSTFILRKEGHELRIVFYLNHQDVTALIASRTG